MRGDGILLLLVKQLAFGKEGKLLRRRAGIDAVLVRRNDKHIDKDGDHSCGDDFGKRDCIAGTDGVLADADTAISGHHKGG